MSTLTGNTAADALNKVIMFADSTTPRTVTNLFTFDRGANPPFAVGASATKVANLDADKVDGIEGTAMLQKSGGVMTGQLQAQAGTVALPGLSVGDTDVGLYSSGVNALDFATNAIKALGITANQFINSPTQPNASVRTSASAQSLVTGTWTTVNFNAEDFDIGSMHDNAVNNSRFTIPTGGDGLYLIIGMVTFDANATGQRAIAIAKNGSRVMQILHATTSTGQTAIQVVNLLSLVAADFIELHAFQGSGGNLSINNTDLSRFMIVKLW